MKKHYRQEEGWTAFASCTLPFKSADQHQAAARPFEHWTPARNRVHRVSFVDHDPGLLLSRRN